MNKNFDIELIEDVDNKTKVFLLRHEQLDKDLTVTVHLMAENTYRVLHQDHTAEVWLEDNEAIYLVDELRDCLTEIVRDYCFNVLHLSPDDAFSITC